MPMRKVDLPLSASMLWSKTLLRVFIQTFLRTVSSLLEVYDFSGETVVKKYSQSIHFPVDTVHVQYVKGIVGTPSPIGRYENDQIRCNVDGIAKQHEGKKVSLIFSCPHLLAISASSQTLSAL